MQLTVLGTAAPFPVPGNACSGYLLRSGAASTSTPDAAASPLPERPAEHPDPDPGVTATAVPGPLDPVPGTHSTAVWIDAGTGTFAELQRHIAPGDLDAIFISHRHADHTADLLVASYAYRFGLSPAFASRGDRRIRVFGPEGLGARLADYLGPTARAGLESVFEFTELHGWGTDVVGDLELSWGPVSHGVPAFGLTVRELPAGAAGAAGGASGAAGAAGAVAADAGAASGAALPAERRGFAYSGDTGPCISLVELAEESSTLLCEAGYAEAPSIEYVHCTPEDAGRQAAEAGVSTLILTHIADGLSPASAVARARSTFAGEVLAAVPGATYAV